MFIGVMSNALFGLIQDASGERRSFWPWAKEYLFLTVATAMCLWYPCCNGTREGTVSEHGFRKFLSVEIRNQEKPPTPLATERSVKAEGVGVSHAAESGSCGPSLSFPQGMETTTSMAPLRRQQAWMDALSRIFLAHYGTQRGAATLHVL